MSSIDDVEAAATGDVNAAASDSGSLLAGLETDHMFELRVTTVRFLKDGCLLSVVTGPTTSGKTALPVRRRVPPLFALSQSLVWYLDGAARRDDTTTRKDRHLQQHIKDRREWILACHFVRCSISVAVYQGQHPVRIPLDEEWYNAVVECCALKPDLETGRGQRLGPGLGRSEG